MLPQAPPEILSIWRKFDSFPMETLTKAWFLKNAPNTKQRTVEQMREQYKRYGATGNCFDLGLWLIDELNAAGIPTYGVGEHWGTTDAHVAVVALDSSGRRYLCDLGDLWIQPVLIDAEPAQLAEKRAGFFTGAEVSMELKKERLKVTYWRPGGKMSQQIYDLTPVPLQEYVEYGRFSQSNLSKPLVEMRLFRPEETVHWEYENGGSFVSSMRGLDKEPPLASDLEWSQRISKMTGMSAGYVLECLEAYEELSR